MAQRMTAPMRCRTRRAVSGRVCQIGTRQAITSAVAILSTGVRPRRGYAYVVSDARHCFSDLPPGFHPAACIAMTFSVACSNVGTRLPRGPRPCSIVRRFSSAFFLASARETAAGRFLLTGSAAPTDAPTHSGAGRIVTVRMRPLSLAERGLPAAVTLSSLLSGRRPSLQGDSDMGLTGYANEIVRSGFPATRTLSPRLVRVQLDSYIDRIVGHDFKELGRNVRDRRSLRSWLTAFAAATSTSASYATIRDAATPGEPAKPAKSTAIAYRRTLEQLWMIEEVPAWLPTSNRITRLAASPVHQLADPALAARLLGVDVDALIDGVDAGPPIPSPDYSWAGGLDRWLVVLGVMTIIDSSGVDQRKFPLWGGWFGACRGWCGGVFGR